MERMFGKPRHKMAAILRTMPVGLLLPIGFGLNAWMRWRRGWLAVFYELENVPLALKLAESNEWLGEEVIVFERPSWAEFRLAVEKEPALW